jgi:purine-binding chemotaxis protein CheW
MTASDVCNDLQIVNFTIDGVSYGVPVEQVREVRDIQTVTPIPQAPSYVEGVTNLRGQIITVVDLRKRLGLPQKDKVGDKRIVIIIEKSAVGVIVDSVTEVSTIKGQDLENDEAVRGNDSVIGIGKQGNHLTIVLDIAKTVSKENVNKIDESVLQAPTIAA